MKSISLALFSLLALMISPRLAHAAIRVDDLRCEYRQNPIEIDSDHPRLSWVLSSDVRGQRQTAYQILVATTPELLAKGTGDLWDSGKVARSATNQISYNGKPLPSRQQCYWKVQVFDKDDQPSDWSAPASWDMGLLSPEDWKAKWIMMSQPVTRPTTMPAFRKDFTVAKPIRRATIYICGLGQFELHLNGQKVGEDVLQPGWTNYRKTCLYVAYDLTDQVKQGENAVGVILGNGMYYSSKVRYVKLTDNFGPLKLIAQLHLDYTDGTSDVIGTDSSWKTALSPITFNNIYGGEDHDAQLEQPGWDKPGFDDQESWAACEEVNGPGGELRGSSHSAPPIRVAQVLPSKSVTEPVPGTFVYDLGQNSAIMPKFTFSGPAGAQVTIRQGELLARDGTVSQATAVHAPGEWCIYTLKGGGKPETWSPTFFYMGSRYIQVNGAVPADRAVNAQNTAVVQDVAGQFITSTAPTVGDFSCSSDLFNRTASLIHWAIRSNSVSVLTDCPHREKLGWLEQDHLVGPSLMYAMDASVLFNKVCADMADSQTGDGLVPNIAPEYVTFKGDFRDSPEWGSAAVLLPWQLYNWYGDERVLGAQYEVMTRYLAYLGSMSKDNIVSHGLSDWYDLGPKALGPSQLTPKALSATSFYYGDIKVVEKVARILGKTDDAEQYAKLAADVRDSFLKELYHSDTHECATGSQAANALPLVFGLVPDGDRQSVLDNLVKDIRDRDNKLTAGEVGYRYVLRALADGGRSDVIFDMNSRDDRPGYGMMLKKGATSLTEAWDASGKSQDHFMLGHIQEWFYGDLAGIQQDTDSVGYAKVRIKPSPVGDITWAKATYKSIRGPISSSWKRDDAGHFSLDVEIPVNVTATVYVPGGDVTEGGKPAAESDGVKFLRMEGNTAVFAVESGKYSFASK
jgi:hypothetical protein